MPPGPELARRAGLGGGGEGWPAQPWKVGYQITAGPGATVEAASFDPKSGACRTVSR
jgi:hypothetical protein